MRSREEEEEDAPDSSSSLNRLPDELILEILTKSSDLKTLCFCHLVSRRFSSLVLQIDTISFIAPLLTPPTSDTTISGDLATVGFPKNLFSSLLNGVVLKPFHLLRRLALPSGKPLTPIISSSYGDSFRSAVSFLSKFRGVKSLSFELPSSSHRGKESIDNTCLFKWKVSFGNRIESFIFLSPSSIHDTFGTITDNRLIEDESIALVNQKVHIAYKCLKDVIVRHRMLLFFIKDLPNLEKISVTDSARRGTLCVSGGRVAEVRRWLSSVPEIVRPEVPVGVSRCYLPVLNLPVSGYEMKGISFVVIQMSDNVQDGSGCWMNCGEFEDRVEAAYIEAVTEILENHRDKMKRLL